MLPPRRIAEPLPCRTKNSAQRKKGAQRKTPRGRRRTRFCLAIEPLHERRMLSAVALVSVASDGSQGDLHSRGAAISGNGLYVAFDSESTNLVPGDTNASTDIFVKSLQTGALERINLASDGSQGNHHSRAPAISHDGRFVAFESEASNLVAGDTNGVTDVFVYDRQSGSLERVSVRSDGTQGNHHSKVASISGDGRYVAFESLASNLVDGDVNGASDVFVYDRQDDAIVRVSLPAFGPHPGGSHNPAMSADGRYVAFESFSGTLVAGDTNADWDVFVYDLQTDEIERVSLSSGGVQGNNGSHQPSLSHDGQFVAFHSGASNFVSGDTNGKADVFVYDRQTDTIEGISFDANGTPGTSDSFRAVINGDGRYIAFDSYATNLVANDTNVSFDVFVYDRGLDYLQRVSIAVDGQQGDRNSFAPSISDDGRYLAFVSDAMTLLPDANDKADVLLARVAPLSVADSIVATDRGGPPRVQVRDSVLGAVIQEMVPYNAGFTGGVRVATGDVNGDQVPDIVVAPGPGGGPHIRIYDGLTRQWAGEFFAYDIQFAGGVYVAVGDIDLDGRAEIITGADASGGPHVRVFDAQTGAIERDFFAYGLTFTGGVRVASADVDFDGHAEIITAAGAGGGPHVRVFSGQSGAVIRDFFAYNLNFTGGVYLAAADLDGDHHAEVITSAGAGGGPHVRAFRGSDQSELHSFFAYNPAFAGGVRVAVADLNRDGQNDILTAAGPGGGPHVRGFDGASLAQVANYFAFDASFTDGLFLAGRAVEISPLSLLLATPAPDDLPAIENATEEAMELMRTAAIDRWHAGLPQSAWSDVDETLVETNNLHRVLLGLTHDDPIRHNLDEAASGWAVEPALEVDESR